MTQSVELFILNDDQPIPRSAVLAIPEPLTANGSASVSATSLPSPIKKIRLELVTDDKERFVPRGYAPPAELYQSDAAQGSTSTQVPPAPFALLAQVPDWAYRCYAVSPEQQGTFQSHLYLFNVIVALEWEPDSLFLEQLRWAFQQASDFLFDATDGWMAFGQVVVGGVNLMGSADIQIMASNRLHPRSWVGGLFEKEQHRPIRIGRGIWSDRQEVAFTWEEPEAYRILVHEWGHYALYLTDEYLSPPKRIAAGTPGAFTVIVPQIVAGTESIMANTEGISELSSQAWEELRTNRGHYTKIRVSSQPRGGPQRVPGALPRFFLQQHWYEQQMQASHSPTVVIPKRISEAGKQLFDQLQKSPQFRHCWLYVLQNNAGKPVRILAQGSLDARSERRDYPLLGAKPDDTVVLISTPPNDRPITLYGKVGSDGRITDWQPYQYQRLPIVDVVPVRMVGEQDGSQVYVRVRFSDGTQPTQVAIFPLGQVSNQTGLFLEKADQSEGTDWISTPVPMPTLDGHVFVQSEHGLAITSFSQGGDPPFHNPAPANPINAGSADGNAMLFFYHENSANREDSPYRQIKIVTTRIAGIPYIATLPPQTHILSAAYSVASNAALPAELDPTLILYYSLPEELMNLASLNQGEVLVYRLAGSTWIKQSYVFAPITRGSLFVAMPLYDRLEHHAGGSLVQDETDPPLQRTEVYAVCWSPHTA
jgi:hypothetical protein